ncbi:MAG TPA: hypothetical protein VIF09_15675, partial [Polyangiaceae bacterium]
PPASESAAVAQAAAPPTPAAPPAPVEHRATPSKGAERGSPAAAPPVVAGSGRLNVAARGGWCNVSIDGAGRGPTPVAGVVLPAGAHTVTCTPETGHLQTATVRVEADGIARYSFTLSP